MQRLMSSDWRVIYLTMLILVSLPLLNPLGIPLDINKGTRDVFEQLDAVPAGKRVLFSINYAPTSAADIAPQAKVMLDHLMSNAHLLVHEALVEALVPGGVLAPILGGDIRDFMTESARQRAVRMFNERRGEFAIGRSG